MQLHISCLRPALKPKPGERTRPAAAPPHHVREEQEEEEAAPEHDEEEAPSSTPALPGQAAPAKPAAKPQRKAAGAKAKPKPRAKPKPKVQRMSGDEMFRELTDATSKPWRNRQMVQRLEEMLIRGPDASSSEEEEEEEEEAEEEIEVEVEVEVEVVNADGTVTKVMKKTKVVKKVGGGGRRRRKKGKPTEEEEEASSLAGERKILLKMYRLLSGKGDENEKVKTAEQVSERDYMV